MKFRWNARGDSVSTMVLWLGSLIAAIICVAWLAKNFNPQHMTVQAVDNELTTLQRTLNSGCKFEKLWKTYYPRLEQGTLIINDLQVCIDTNECSVLYYSSNETEPVIKGFDMILNNSRLCKKINNCKPFYYSSENNPIVYSDHIFLKNATTCDTKDPYVLRCRLLMCDLNTTQYIGLYGLTSVNITVENGTWNFSAY